MKLTEEQIDFLIKFGDGTEEMVSPNHPQHHECIKDALENAMLLVEAAQAYDTELDNKRFEKTWGKIKPS